MIGKVNDVKNINFLQKPLFIVEFGLPPVPHEKHSSRVLLRKRDSENMQQIYRRTPKPKCDFSKVGCFPVN